MSFLINPYAFLAAGGDFESIATVTVGSGGASSIEFTSIPGTYQHLQVRLIARDNNAQANGNYMEVTVNSDTGSNYAYHDLFGTGATVLAAGLASQSAAYAQRIPTANAENPSNTFGAVIIDVLDYASASKFKTFRQLGGWDANGVGRIYLVSNLWRSTSAITGIKVAAVSASFVQHSTAALYGIKAP